MRYDLDVSPKIKATLDVILDFLSDGKWHPIADVQATVQQTTGAAPRTVENLVRSASAKRLLHYRGKPLSRCQIKGRNDA